MADFGRVLAVNTHTVGDQVVGNQLVGFTVLQLDDVSEFPTEGGTISTTLGLLDYTSGDPDADTLTLAAPLPATLLDEARVDLWDADRGAVVTETIASVELEGSTDDGDPFEAVVPQSLRAYLPEGISEGAGVVVEVDVEAEQVTDVPGRTPQLDGQAVWNPHSFRTATKNIPNGTLTKVNGWTDVETDGIGFSTATWTIKTPGWYAMTMEGEWATNATGKRQMTIRVNGAAYRQRVEAADATDTTYMDSTTQTRLVEGDQVEFWVFQNSGAGLSLNFASFSLYRVSI